MLPFILNGIILTASRSATLGLMAAGMGALALAPRARRWFLIPCAGLGLVLFLMLAKDDTFWDRANTIRNTNVESMDASAASRLTIARANFEMFLDHPLGVGHRGNEYLSSQYLPREVLTYNADGEAVRSSHTTVMAVLADQGIPGAVLFLVLLGWVSSRLYVLWRFDQTGLDPKLGGLRAAIGASLFGLFASSFFVNILKLELTIWLFAMLTSLDIVARHSLHSRNLDDPESATCHPKSTPRPHRWTPAVRTARQAHSR
jgi:hypothetical protein